MGSVRHTPQTRARVIAEFANCGRIDLACQIAGCSRDAHYEWLQKFPEYKEAFEAARDRAVDMLEAEAHRRAHEGVTKPIFQQGRHVGDVQEYSDSLLTFLLKARRPAIFGDRTALEHTGAGGAPLTVTVEFVKPKGGA